MCRPQCPEFCRWSGEDLQFHGAPVIYEIKQRTVFMARTYYYHLTILWVEIWE